MRWAAARDIFERIAQWADRHSPQTLFARALIIIVVPMLLLPISTHSICAIYVRLSPLATTQLLRVMKLHGLLQRLFAKDSLHVKKKIKKNGCPISTQHSKLVASSVP